MDILRALTENEVDELLELYKQHYGLHNFHYLLLYNQRKWDKQLRSVEDNRTEDVNVSLRKTFYTHRHTDFREYGTYVSLHYDLMQSVSFNSWQPDLVDLKECLEQTQLIQWHTGPLLTNVDLLFCDLVKELALSKGARVQRARRCHGLILPHERALNLVVPDLPKGYVLKPLHLNDAELIHSQWPNAKEGSLQYIRALIGYNKTLGIYRQMDTNNNNDDDDDNDDDEDGEVQQNHSSSLIAWIFQNDFSGLGILQVQPSVQRQGFGKLLAIAMSQQIAVTEAVALSAWIVVENYRSEALLENIGYEKTVINEWIQLEA